MIQEKIKRRLNSRTFSFCLLSKPIKIRIYKNMILPVVLYWCETLKEEHRLRVLEKVLRRIFGLRGMK
jgi:hypothetical protein